VPPLFLHSPNPCLVVSTKRERKKEKNQWASDDTQGGGGSRFVQKIPMIIFVLLSFFFFSSSCAPAVFERMDVVTESNLTWLMVYITLYIPSSILFFLRRDLEPIKSRKWVLVLVPMTMPLIDLTLRTLGSAPFSPSLPPLSPIVHLLLHWATPLSLFYIFFHYHYLFYYHYLFPGVVSVCHSRGYFSLSPPPPPLNFSPLPSPLLSFPNLLLKWSLPHDHLPYFISKKKKK